MASAFVFRLCLALCGCGFSLALAGQITTVELRSGHRVHGELLEYARGSHLTVLTFDDDTLRIDYADYHRHRARLIQSRDVEKYLNAEYPGYRRVARLYVDASFGLIWTRYRFSSSEFDTYAEALGMGSIGFNLNQRSSLGYSLAISYNSGQEFAHYLDYRIKLTDTPSAFEVRLRAGISINSQGFYRYGTSERGFAFYPELAYVHRTRNRWGYFLGVGAAWSRRVDSYYENGNFRVDSGSPGRFAVRAGFIF